MQKTEGTEKENSCSIMTSLHVSVILRCEARLEGTGCDVKPIKMLFRRSY